MHPERRSLLEKKIGPLLDHSRTLVTEVISRVFIADEGDGGWQRAHEPGSIIPYRQIEAYVRALGLTGEQRLQYSSSSTPRLHGERL